MAGSYTVPPRDALVSGVAAAWPGHCGSQGQTSLILGDAAPDLYDRLVQCENSPRRWHRILSPGQQSGPWPEAGHFDQVWLRLPRSGREIRMLLALASARVSPEGFIAVYGAKDEGIRSVDKHRPDCLVPFETEFVKRRCRVLVSRRNSCPPDPSLGHLDAWRSESTIDWGAGPTTWSFYPGVFAHGRLDPATRLLIDHVPPLTDGARILDYGAGSGIIGAALLGQTPNAVVELLDADALALAAASVNVPTALRIHGTNLSSAPGDYDLIVSNPPIHEGKDETLRIVQSMCREAPSALKPTGSLMIVVQRRLGAESLLAQSFRHVAAVADDGPFRVLLASARR